MTELKWDYNESVGNRIVNNLNPFKEQIYGPVWMNLIFQIEQNKNF
jgi:hypothetical protein